MYISVCVCVCVHSSQSSFWSLNPGCCCCCCCCCSSSKISSGVGVVVSSSSCCCESSSEFECDFRLQSSSEFECDLGLQSFVAGLGLGFCVFWVRLHSWRIGSRASASYFFMNLCVATRTVINLPAELWEELVWFELETGIHIGHILNTRQQATKASKQESFDRIKLATPVSASSSSTVHYCSRWIEHRHHVAEQVSWGLGRIGEVCSLVGDSRAQRSHLCAKLPIPAASISCPTNCSSERELHDDEPSCCQRRTNGWCRWCCSCGHENRL